MIDENKKKFNLKRLEKLSEKLKKNGFETFVFEDSKSAVNHVLSVVGKSKKIGHGGCQTIKEIGLVEKLKDMGNEIITHAPGMDRQTRIETWIKAQIADFYFASPQAITMNGELIFIDGHGNRVAAVIYGPKKVLLIAGNNKIVKDLQEGFWRMRNVAAIANNIRLGKKNPCVISGKCEDCDSETRICNVASILYKKPTSTDYQIILINEELGY